MFKKRKTDYEIQMERIESFEENVINHHLIYDENGELPINPVGIGVIKKVNDRDIEIEFRDVGTRSKKEGRAWYQLPYYAKGVLRCYDCSYSYSSIKSSGVSFYIYKENDGKFVVLASRNNQGIKIKCSKIEVMEFAEEKIDIDKHRQLVTDLATGKYFSIELS